MAHLRPGDPTVDTTSEPYAAQCHGCDEGRAASGLTRRNLLRGALATGAALAIGPNLGVRFASAAMFSGFDILVVLFFCGGFDGLSAIMPVTDTDYYTLRPTIGVPA